MNYTLRLHEELSAILLQHGGELVALSGRILIDPFPDEVPRDVRNCALAVVQAVALFQNKRRAS